MRINRILPSVRASLLTLLLLPLSGIAQTSTGQLSVVVTDPSGARVPTAPVRLSGSETGNLLRTVETNTTGVAAFPLLPPGVYDVTVAASGFKAAVRKGVAISVGSVVDLPVTVETGNVTESVTVTAAAPVIEEKSATLAQVIDDRQMTDLPLNGRNYLALANLTAGAIPSSGSRDQTFSAHGNSGLQNAFLLDGGRNENYLRGLDNRARDMIRPPLDALAEFSVQTSNFSAEFGAAAGGVVNAVTKSGTNTIHGSAYNFLRNDNLDARNFFAKTKPLLVRNQYGGSLGGPVIKDKAWLFGAFEGVHNRNESTSTATVPTADQKAGLFGSTAIFDPATTRANPNGSGYIRDLFAGNIVPASRMAALGKQAAEWYPAANVAGAPTQYVRNVPQTADSKNGVVRGDAQVTAKDWMFGRYSISRSGTLAEAALVAPAGLPVDRSIDSASLGYGYTRTLSPSMINELRMTWTSINMHQDGTVARNEIIAGSLDPRISSGIPNFNVSGFAGLGAQPGCCGNSPLKKTSGVWDWSDNVSWTKANHVIKFGGETMLIRPGTFAASNGRGSFGFSGVFTQNPQARAGTGQALADLLLGTANSLTTGTIAEAVERGWFASGYVQDQWTVTPRLTLSLGVRYEYASPYVESSDRMGNFILNPADSNYGKLIMAGTNGYARSLVTGDGNNWAPRIGLAYRVPGVKDLVVRSSVGLFYAQDQGTGVTNRMTSNPPFFGYGAQTISSDQLNPSTGFVLAPGAAITRPAAIQPSQFVLVPTSTSTLVSWPGSPRSPYVQQWSFGIEKRLFWGMGSSLNYVGNHGLQMIGIGEGNQPAVLNATTVVSRRPLSKYTVASVKELGNWNSSNYHGLSGKVEKRLSNGISLLSTFTYGHAIDIQNPALDLCDNCGSGSTIQDNANRRANRASADNDVRFRYVAAATAELPFGKGKRYLSGAKAGSMLAGGWRLSVIYQTQTGLPFTPGLSFDAANAGTTTRPNRSCDGNTGGGPLTKYFDTACFSVPTSYTFGNSGRNVLRAPGVNLLDLTVQRDFRLPIEHETILQFRAEAYNSLNKAQFGVPGATVGNAAYGMITGTSSDARQLQFGVRATF